VRTPTRNDRPQASLTEIVRLSQLTLPRRNAHTHTKKQIRQIADSIREFGWTYPILTDENKRIIAGVGRYAAAAQLGLQLVPVLAISGLSEAKKRALALADNKIAANAGWDRAILAAELGELADLLPKCDLKIELTGFEPAEIDALMGDLVDPERDPSDDIPAINRDPISRRGDLWLLERHRLSCGDARSAPDVGSLMGFERATMVFTDPPYNVQVKSIQGRGKIRHREFVQASGEMSSDAFTAFLVECLSLAAENSINGSVHFVCIDWRHLGELLTAGKEVYRELTNLAVWVKSNAGQGSFYRSQHELIFVFKHGQGSHLNNIELGRHGRNRSNVWSYPGVNAFRAGRLDDLALHPTVKPVALVADAMRDCTRRGDIVLDPFIGSGTTILAAERVGRRGYGLEIDPQYVDVAVRRWQAFTKRDAILAGTEQTFDEISAERASAGNGRRG
jgi:DNA modification methylase